MLIKPTYLLQQIRRDAEVKYIQCSLDHYEPGRVQELLLQPSLSGNARISVICTINPVPTAVAETTSTLLFAQRVKRVQVRHLAIQRFFTQINVPPYSLMPRRGKSLTPMLCLNSIGRRSKISSGNLRSVRPSHQIKIEDSVPKR